MPGERPAAPAGEAHRVPAGFRNLDGGDRPQPKPKKRRRFGS